MTMRRPVEQHKNIFTLRVLDVVSRIPRGEVLSYREVATRAGSPFATRAVGNILSKNFNPNIPCHRVIRSDGSSGGYNRGEKRKQFLLKNEGVSIVARKNHE